MQRIFNYGDADNSDKYFEEIELDALKVKLSACTVPNGDSKPNEDAFSIVVKDKILWIGVFDGTTSLRVINKLQGMTGAKYASSFLKNHFVIQESDLLKSPKHILLELNQKLLSDVSNLGGMLADTHSLPAAMTAIVKVDFNKMTLNFANVGDTWIVNYGLNNVSQLITNDTNKRFDDEILELIQNIARQKRVTNRIASQDDAVKESQYKMYLKRNNNPNGQGSGLVNGDPNLWLYIQEDEFDLSNTIAVLIGTDGLEIQGQSLLNENYRNFLLKNYLEGGFKKLISQKRMSEDNDPEWKYPRYKHSDDATGVFVDFS